MAAFELALRQGAEGIELDVHLSSDGMPMVIHDPRLSRTTSGSGWVSEHRANALRRLDAGSWFNRRFPEKARHRYVGAKIPLLSEVLAWVRQHKILAFVEIKGGRNAYPGIEAKVLDEIERAGVRRLATIVSFDLATLRRVRELDSPHLAWSGCFPVSARHPAGKVPGRQGRPSTLGDCITGIYPPRARAFDSCFHLDRGPARADGTNDRRRCGRNHHQLPGPACGSP